MEFFDQLGRHVEQLWKEKDHDVEQFPSVAERALQELRPSDHVDHLDVIRWSQRAEKLPVQQDLAGEFGNPPITVYHSKGFNIAVLFWVDGTTSIHQHGFSGAFHVLEGSSIHSRYSFQPLHRFNEDLIGGEVRFHEIELLTKGAIRPIQVGAEFIHSLFHLDRPSASVVVRTHVEPRAHPQYQYLKPGLAMNPFYRGELLTRRMQTLNFLRAIESPEFEQAALELVRRSDSIEAFYLVRTVFGLVKEEPLFKQFLARIHAERPQLVSFLEPAFDELRREANIISRRGRIRDKDHRFFMALLLNTDDKRRLLELVARKYSGANPVDKVLEWVSALGSPKAKNGENAIGIPLDESSLFIFRCLLEGLSFPELLERMKGEYDDEDVQQQIPAIQEMCQAFRGSLLFSALFRQ